MSFTVAEIANSLGAQAAGDTSIVVTRAAEPQDARANDIALAMSAKYAGALTEGQAKVAMLWPGADWESFGLEAAIFPPRPRYAMSGVTKMLDPGQGFAPGIHPSAIIDPTAELADDVAVGPLAIISAGAKIGAGSIIGPHSFVGAGVTLGLNTYLREHVSIGARVTVGDRCIFQPGSRVGGDGFSFVTEEASFVEEARSSLGEKGEASSQDWIRIHTLGSVTIGDDVELGMNATVDCGTVRDTTIGNNTKLDNLVHLGHNVTVGENCLLCGQAGIAGSVRIGNNVVLGGQVGVTDNIFIGDGVIAGGGTKILSNAPAGRALLGYPGTQMDKQVEQYKALRRLPRMLREVAELRKAVFKSDKDD